MKLFDISPTSRPDEAIELALLGGTPGIQLLEGEDKVFGAVAAGTRRAGESKENVPEAPSKGFLDMFPRDFDILNEHVKLKACTRCISQGCTLPTYMLGMALADIKVFLKYITYFA